MGDLAERAAEMGMDALALTDHDGMYGAVRFTLACNHFGVRPILGTELEWGDGFHAVLLAKDKKGWANLCRLVTKMHLDSRAQSLEPGRRPRTSFEEIANHSEGLIALSGCDRGEVNWHVALGQTEIAEQAARRWLDVFGVQDFAIEISNHLRHDDYQRSRRLTELGSSLGANMVATNNVHYVDRNDAVVHDIADCIRRIVPLSSTTAPRENSEYCLKSEDEMAELHTAGAIETSRLIADRCEYQLPLGEFHFPDLPAEKGGPDRSKSSTEILAAACWKGLRSRFHKITKEIDDRLQMELQMIRWGGFCGYFLLVADIVEHARNVIGIRCACRGSAAGSLVAYALGISDVDPIRHNLSFERFMNRYRREIPDIDIDFESARRDQVLRYILDTYGERTAMVAMMDTFRARGALREVGKALGLPLSEIDLIAKTFPHISASKIPQALEGLPEVAAAGLNQSKLEVLFELASRLDSYPRHLALHPSAVILSDESLRDLMPMQNSFEGFLMSQFDKDDVEALGIAKLDVLGIRMLSAMTHTIDEIERTRGFRPDIDSAFGRGNEEKLSVSPQPEPGSKQKVLKIKDKATFELIRDSRTMGCFQIESPGQRELLGKFQPDQFEDLIIDISLFRPGPVKSDMVRPFLERRHGFEPVFYPHPSLVQILKETKGVIVYHEQVMKVIDALTGCGMEKADKIRRQLDNTFEAPDPATGKPAGLSLEQKALKDGVVSMAVDRGWKRELAEKIWTDVLQFASFGFCKAHAAAFAVPTYQSAWLKAHFPAEFYCGVLTHDPGMYPRRAILADARSHGVSILGMDVNLSAPEYRTEPPLSIRLALKDVKGISDGEISSIVDGRPWRSFQDFCERAEASRPVVEALVHCGAFDSIKGKRSRRELFWMVEERWSERIRRRAEQMALDISSPEEIQLPGISDYSDREKVEAELEVIGMDASRHLISFYSGQLQSLGWTPASELRRQKSGKTVVVAGVKVATQTPPVRSGKRVIFLTLEDGTGQADVALFEEVQAKYARKVFDSWILAVRGTVRRTGEKGVSILGEEVIDLSSPEDPPKKLWHSSGGSAGR